MIDPKYASHLPILTRIMDLTHGDVLEIGAGLWSTPLLHIMCDLQKRYLLSLDNDEKWFSENEKWKTDTHNVFLLKEWESLAEILGDTHWSVAFVDEKPAKHRIKSVKLLAQHANFVVIHDSEPESDKYFKYKWIYKLFKYRYDYTKLRPNTTVLSNFVDVSKLLQ